MFADAAVEFARDAADRLATYLLTLPIAGSGFLRRFTMVGHSMGCQVALEHYRLAVAQFPGSPVAALELAKLLREMEAPQEALRTVQEANARIPANWELRSLEADYPILSDPERTVAARVPAGATRVRPGVSGPRAVTSSPPRSSRTS